MTALVCAVLFVGFVHLGQTEMDLTDTVAIIVGFVAWIGAPVALVASIVALAVGA
jgi:hypothetical protein